MDMGYPFGCERRICDCSTTTDCQRRQRPQHEKKKKNIFLHKYFIDTATFQKNLENYACFGTSSSKALLPGVTPHPGLQMG
jgi:hypothetical protein